MRDRILRILVGVGLAVCGPGPCWGKVLFLAHWNGGLRADAAGGRAEPAIAAGSRPPRNGAGFPFKDSMPAVNGLEIEDGSILAYATAGNMEAAEGTIDFWSYPRRQFVAGPEAIPHRTSATIRTAGTCPT